MRIVALDSAFYKLYRQDVIELGEEAQKRLKLVESFERLRRHGISGDEAAEILGPSRATIYRWRRRLARSGPRGLERRSSRPRRVRQRSWTPQLIAEVEKLRRRLSRRWHARRLPRGAPKPTSPGERVQIDTLHICPEAGISLKHFSASCPVSRWTVGDLAVRATSTSAARFLEKVMRECPFPIEAIQVDGGSEFMAAFETACNQHGIQLFVLPPKSPKLNGTVESMQETWRGEFYEAYELPSTVTELRPLVQRFQDLYNTFRPHQSLQQRTPARYLRELLPGVRLPPTVSDVLI